MFFFLIGSSPDPVFGKELGRNANEGRRVCRNVGHGKPSSANFLEDHQSLYCLSSTFCLLYPTDSQRYLTDSERKPTSNPAEVRRNETNIQKNR